MTRSIGRAFIALLSITLLGSSCSSDVCYVSSPEEYAAISDDCMLVFVTGWPTDELDLASTQLERTVHIGAVEGVEGSVPFELRRITTEGIGAVYGKATEEAALRDVVLANVEAPDLTVEPRVFEEPCSVWGPDEGPESSTRMSLFVLPNTRLHVVAASQLMCFNLSLTMGGGLVEPGYDPWSTFSLLIDEFAQPAGFVYVDASESVVLDDLKQLGFRAKQVQVANIDDETFGAYLDWLGSQAYEGLVERCRVSSSVEFNCDPPIAVQEL
jgi:hypothetical protein